MEPQAALAFEQAVHTLNALDQRRTANYERIQEAKIEKLSHYIPKNVAKALGAVFFGNVAERRIDADMPIRGSRFFLLVNHEENNLRKDLQSLHLALASNHVVDGALLKRVEENTQLLARQIEQDKGVNTDVKGTWDLTCG